MTKQTLKIIIHESKLKNIKSIQTDGNYPNATTWVLLNKLTGNAGTLIVPVNWETNWKIEKQLKYIKCNNNY